MPFDYQRVKRCLQLDESIAWLKKDSSDDFFVDALNFSDIVQRSKEYCDERQHRILQLEAFQALSEEVPKSNGMFREAIVLHPAHRVLYLACLRYLLPKLDPHVSREVYSYRVDQNDAGDYPFPDRANRWKAFANDFRSACLDDDTGAVLITDIASFYDHIRCDDLVSLIRSMLGPRVSEDDDSILQFLHALFLQWTNTGFGIPQNYDASSFFGSLYLDPIDKDIVSKRYRYFRWVDDIRICAKSRKQAERALHDLQRSLARYRLFLASDKTRIIEKGSDEYDRLVDVSDEFLISEVEVATDRGKRELIDAVLPAARERLVHHAGSDGEDRKFRAFANRLLAISDFPEYREELSAFVAAQVIPKLVSNPSRSDFWVRLLCVNHPDDFLPQVDILLRTDPSVHNWQRFHLWRLLVMCGGGAPLLVEKALTLVNNPVSEIEASQAAIYAGKFGSPADRERLWNLFGRQRSYFLQRGILIGLQEMERARRDIMYRRAVEMAREHKELVEHLSSLERPNYGEKPRSPRALNDSDVPKFEIPFLAGVGTVSGKIVRFRLSRADYDYE